MIYSATSTATQSKGSSFWSVGSLVSSRMVWSFLFRWENHTLGWFEMALVTETVQQTVITQTTLCLTKACTDWRQKQTAYRRTFLEPRQGHVLMITLTLKVCLWLNILLQLNLLFAQQREVIEPRSLNIWISIVSWETEIKRGDS